MPDESQRDGDTLKAEAESARKRAEAALLMARRRGMPAPVVVEK